MSIPSSGSSTCLSASTTSSFVAMPREYQPRKRCQAPQKCLAPGTRSAQTYFFPALAGEEVDAVDEAHPVAARAHDERMRSRRVGEELHAAQQVAVRDTRG